MQIAIDSCALIYPTLSVRRKPLLSASGTFANLPKAGAFAASFTQGGSRNSDSWGVLPLELWKRQGLRITGSRRLVTSRAVLRGYRGLHGRRWLYPSAQARAAL
jgi:hypothetical protein